MNEYNKVIEAKEFLLDKIQSFKPSVGIILGTGLGGLVEEIEVKYELQYSDIPHFPLSTVETHSGKLIFGMIEGVPVVAMHGRFHYYEGYSMQQVVFPVRVMKLLGIERLFVSNASGGINPNFEVSDLMVIHDHINLQPENPLVGKNIDELGPRFPDMSEPYDKGMINKAFDIARENKITLHKGVYASVTGPNLETRAEYRYLKTIGADNVGMSTVPEIIAARHMDLPCFALSVITDMGIPELLKKADISEIIAAAAKAEPNLAVIFKALIKS